MVSVTLVHANILVVEKKARTREERGRGKMTSITGQKNYDGMGDIASLPSYKNGACGAGDHKVTCPASLMCGYCGSGNGTQDKHNTKMIGR